ncbi:hypothetical protein [Acaryochloris marina]|uniref:Uncharacterized protein n=1 Tax=Acaryochloris marina (strain MBIC 11017) TaxID=329726 RepID=A8ZPV5_ACAM1|nr:hypothetical protein [Acaryochloris marina]ABW33023.1 hypothetical protein AM1_F0162 [Acaryochloris marina MBIC11017]BDM83192.1 hypothetical protein AM10699_60530 [Acaryochloris marina MBIC10699]
MPQTKNQLIEQVAKPNEVNDEQANQLIELLQMQEGKGKKYPDEQVQLFERACQLTRKGQPVPDAAQMALNEAQQEPQPPAPQEQADAPPKQSTLDGGVQDLVEIAETAGESTAERLSQRPEMLSDQTIHEFDKAFFVSLGYHLQRKLSARDQSPTPIDVKVEPAGLGILKGVQERLQAKEEAERKVLVAATQTTDQPTEPAEVVSEQQ